MPSRPNKTEPIRNPCQKLRLIASTPFGHSFPQPDGGLCGRDLYLLGVNRLRRTGEFFKVASTDGNLIAFFINLKNIDAAPGWLDGKL